VTGPPPHCKVIGIEDFEDAELVGLIRDVWQAGANALPDFPRGHEHRKQWEVAMALRALREGGVLRTDAEALGVGAGFEPTIFWLTRHIARVFATDLYLDSGEWGEANRLMLTDPEACWPEEWNPRRLVVQHMNALELRYPDDSFDAVFSSSSIEHFGDRAQVRRAAEEMHRVLRPGGTASISTEMRLQGPPPGALGLTMFTPEELLGTLVEGIGWKPLSEFDAAISDATLAGAINFEDALRPPPQNPVGAPSVPHLVLRLGEWVFTSCHLALRK